jgi:hypothetical protein
MDLTYVCACLMYLSVGCLIVNCLLLRVGAVQVHITGCRQLLSGLRSLFDSCLQTCMTNTIAVCTVKNS